MSIIQVIVAVHHQIVFELCCSQNYSSHRILFNSENPAVDAAVRVGGAYAADVRSVTPGPTLSVETNDATCAGKPPEIGTLRGEIFDMGKIRDCLAERTILKSNILLMELRSATRCFVASPTAFR